MKIVLLQFNCKSIITVVFKILNHMNYLLDGLESDRLYYRKVKQSDFDQWLVFYKNPLTSRFWVSKGEEPEIKCKKWYEKQFHRYDNNLGGVNALFERQSGEFIGHCGLLVQTVDNVQELEIGYSLLPGFWGKGYAIEAAKKCKDFAFENNLVESLISIISLTNVPSQKVATNNGMKIDKTTVYADNDVYIYRINNSEWISP